MFRFFRATQLSRLLPSRTVFVNPAIRSRDFTTPVEATERKQLIQEPIITDEQRAIDLIKEAREQQLSREHDKLEKHLIKLTKVKKYRAAALLEMGKLNLINGDLLTAKEHFDQAIDANPDFKEARRLYLQTTFAIDGVPKFLASSKIELLSSFAELAPQSCEFQEQAPVERHVKPH